MQTHDDAELLRQFAQEESQEAFEALLKRHIGLVYSAALRQTNGNPQLAQDVAQIVFADLARKAYRFSPSIVLPGWLYAATRFASAKALRAEHRRQAREREAIAMNDSTPETNPEWMELSPLLDAAMAELPESDRDAILLRFFEQHDYRAIGQALGVSQDAAQKRVSRALEALHRILTRRGLASSGTGLATLITAHAVHSAPALVTAAVSTGSLAAASTGATGLGTRLLEFLGSGKAKATLAVTVAGVVIAPLIVEHRSLANLQTENARLRARLSELAELNRLRAENARLSAVQVDTNELARLRHQRLELLRLRNEASALRRELAEAAVKTDATPQSWRVGEVKSVTDLCDAGLQTPEAAFETYWWAVVNDNMGRFAQCIGQPIPVQMAATNAANRRQYLQTGSVSEFRLRSVSTTEPDVARVEYSLRLLVLPSAGEVSPDEAQRGWHESILHAALVRTNSQWCVSFDTCPGPVIVAKTTMNAGEFARFLSQRPGDERSQFLSNLPPAMLSRLQEEMRKQSVAPE